MAWTTPPTFVANATLTAAQLNILRDDLNETGPAKATAAGRFLMTSDANQIAERQILDAIVETSESTSSTAYTDLATAGPSVTMTTGTRVIVDVTCAISNNTAGTNNFATFAVSGATTTSASDIRALIWTPGSAGHQMRGTVRTVLAVNAGSNTFTMKYRVSSGASSGSFLRRRINVQSL